MNKQQLAAELFTVRQCHTQLTQPHEDRGVVFNDIVQLILGSTMLDQAKVMKAVNQSLMLRKHYQQLLKQHQFAASQHQVAASSSGDIADRISEQFSLKFKRDKFSPGQVYVLLQIAHPAAHHNSQAINLHIVLPEYADVVHFPPLDSGQSQLLMDETDAIFNILTNPNAQIVLL
ncbi:MAG: hypothetical protein ACJA13_001080 [Paraglaciecola sp.]|jgi:hypothetical protein